MCPLQLSSTGLSVSINSLPVWKQICSPQLYSTTLPSMTIIHQLNLSSLYSQWQWPPWTPSTQGTKYPPPVSNNDHCERPPHKEPNIHLQSVTMTIANALHTRTKYPPPVIQMLISEAVKDIVLTWNIPSISSQSTAIGHCGHRQQLGGRGSHLRKGPLWQHDRGSCCLCCHGVKGSYGHGPLEAGRLGCLWWWWVEVVVWWWLAVWHSSSGCPSLPVRRTPTYPLDQGWSTLQQQGSLDYDPSIPVRHFHYNMLTVP